MNLAENIPDLNGGEYMDSASPSQRIPCNSLNYRGFSFMRAYGDKKGTKNIDYKPAVLHSKGKKWFVYYSFKNKEGVFKRFKVYENINRIKDIKERREYGYDLAGAINMALKNGYNPFLEEREFHVFKNWTVIESLNYFKTKLQDRGLRKRSIQTYESCIRLLTGVKNLNIPIEELRPAQCQTILQTLKRENEWQNATYNNILTQCRAIWSFFMENSITEKNPFKTLKPLPETINRHQPFDSETWEKIKKNAPPDLLRFMLFLYYTGTRPNEARQLTYDHILRERKQLFIPGNISKNKKDGFVPLSDQFLDMFKGEGFIFGVSTNYFTGKFMKLKEKLKLDKGFTLYSIKHTRAIHLAEDGATPYAIMQLFRHHSLEMTDKYLRSLGLHIGREAAEKERKM